MSETNFSPSIHRVVWMRNLLGRLHERSPSSLAGIANVWGVALRGRDIHQDVGQLFRVMTDPWSFAMTFEQISERARDVFQRLAKLDGGRTGHEIAELLATDFVDLREPLRELYRAGFIYAEQSEMGVDDQGEARLLIPREVHGLFHRIQQERARTDPDKCTLEELLTHLDDADLAEIASSLGYTVIPAIAIRADLIQYVRPRLSDPDRVARSRRDLKRPARSLIDWLEEQGRADPGSARRALLLDTDALRGAIWDLAAVGLIWRGYDENGNLQIVFPTAVRVPAPIPKPQLPDLERVPVDQVEEPEWKFPYAAAWDLLTVLRETQVGATQGLARMLRDGGHGLTAAGNARLAAMLWMASDRDQNSTVPTGYLWFLSALATGEDLIDDRDPPGLSDNVRPWTRLDFSTQQKRLVSHWLRWSHWYEARGRDSVEVWGARWVDFRQALADRLIALDPQRWYTVSSFAERFAVEHPDALGTQFSAALNREHVDESMESRRRDVVRFVTEMTLLTAGSWLGLIETSRARRRGYVFRVTEIGLWALGHREDPQALEPFGEHPLAVQANFDVLLLNPEPRLVWALTGFADLYELDRVSTFQLTEASIHRAIDAGASVEQVLKALERYSGDPVPDNVRVDLQEWAANYRRARVGWGLMVQLSHSGELERLREALAEQGLSVESMAADRLFIGVASDDRRDATARVVRTVLNDLNIAARWGW
jgi:hypothetical protein